MKSYLLNDFSEKEAYLRFIDYMLDESEAFSLVYFKYDKREPTKKSTNEVAEMLKPYKICSHETCSWPSNMTLNENGHIYKLTLYRAERGAFDALAKADGLFDWDYPRFPMDLCFFKGGYAWFVSSGHSQYAVIYTDSDDAVARLSDIGAKIQLNGEIKESNLYTTEDAKRKITADEVRNTKLEITPEMQKQIDYVKRAFGIQDGTQ